MNIDFVLEVKLDDKELYQASTRVLISRLAIPRIQPELEIDVRVDKEDPSKVLLDTALTPYRHYR